MSKKTFQDRPKPKALDDREIDCFVEGGPGNDQLYEDTDIHKDTKLQTQENENVGTQISGNTDTHEPSNLHLRETVNVANRQTANMVSRESEKDVSRLTVEMPASLLRKFKAYSVMRGVPMKDLIREYLESILKKELQN